MIKVNLISHKNRAYKAKNWTKVITFTLFGLLALYFLVISLYVLISISSIRNQIQIISNQTATISKEILDNNDKLSRFVLTKLIISKIQEVNKGRFHYKDYLDQVSLLLPIGSELTAVDFSQKGWIAISVNSKDINTFEVLEKSLMKQENWTQNHFFSGAYIEGISRNKSGGYVVRIQLELSKPE